MAMLPEELPQAAAAAAATPRRRTLMGVGLCLPAVLAAGFLIAKALGF